MRNPEQKTVLYLGNKLNSFGFTPTGVETLGKKLLDFLNVITASDRKNIYLRLFDMIFVLLKNKNKIKVVLIDTYSGKAFYYVLIISLICRILNKKYIPILRGGDLSRRIQKNNFLSKNIFSHSYINIAPSNFIKQKFKNKGFRTIMIPNCINLESYSFFHRISCSPNLLWVRSFHKIYNPKMAILVLNDLLKDFPNASLCMVGPDKDGSLEECEKLSIELNIQKNILFTGLLKKNEWIKKSKKFDIFLNTTNYDNLPVSVLEAMALGLPIISTNAGGLSTFHEDNVDALIVEKKDFLSMANNVRLIISNNSLSKKLSKNARYKAENYGWNILKHQWKTLINSL